MALNNPYALSFDGVDDCAVFSTPGSLTFLNQPDTTGQLTIEFWANIKGGQKIFDSGAGYTYQGILINYLDGTRRIDFRNRYYRWATDGAYMPLNELHHYALVWDGSVLSWIVDGGIKNTVATPSSDNNYRYYSTIRIGSTVNGNLLNGNFDMDEFRVWNHARTQTQIQENMYKTLTGTETGLELYLRFDTGSGNIAYDSSPNANHGTIYGATWVPGLVDLDGGDEPVVKTAYLRCTGASRVSMQPRKIKAASLNFSGAARVKMQGIKTAIAHAHFTGAARTRMTGLVLFIPPGVYVVEMDEIFSKNQPQRGETVANYIEVWVNPLKPADAPQEVYKSSEPVSIPAGETKTITIQYNDQPVIDPSLSLAEAGANLSIVTDETKHYAWGADVAIKNTGAAEQTCLIVATGKPLKVQGREKIVKKDDISIRENGLKKYTFDNPFVQDRATAEMIADKLLSFANARRDIAIEWRGDPALELADVTMIPEYQRRGLDQRGIFYITKQELEFDGGLRAKIEGRKME